MSKISLGDGRLPKLNFNNGISLSQQIAQYYRKQIQDGVFKTGVQLPTCLEISSSLGLAGQTVNRAFDLLARENLVYKRRSLGTIVGSPPGTLDMSHPIRRLVHKVEQPVTMVIRAIPEAPKEKEHNLIFYEYLNGLMDGFNAWKCRFEIANLKADQPEIDLVKALVETNQTRGFIIFSLPIEVPEYLAQQNIPSVALSVDLTNLGISSVIADHVKGYCEAWEYVSKIGHRHAAFCGIETSKNDIRLRECLAAWDLVQPDCRLKTTLKLSSSVVDEKEIWSTLAKEIDFTQKNIERPTVLFAQTDLIATQIIRTLMDHGVKVPEDISVIGFNDSPLVKHFYPALTTLNKPRYQMSFTAAQLFLDILAKRRFNPAPLQVFPVRLVCRETCAQPKF